MTGRRAPAILGAILVLGLALRVWVSAHLALISADGIARISMARAFAEQGFDAGLSACLDRGYHPFNPFLVSLAARALGDYERGGLAVSIAFGTLGIAGIFLLAREAFGEREGLLAALLWALLPNAVHTSADVLTEGQFLAFWILAAWAGLSALRRGSFRGMAWAGVLSGLAYLTRAEGLGVPAALGLALLVPGIPRRLPLGLALSAGFLLAASPYLLHLESEKGRWCLTPGKSVTNLVTKRSTVWEQAPEGKPGREAGFLERVAKYGGPVQTGAKTLTPWVLALALAGLWRRRPWGLGGGFLLVLASIHGLVLLRLFQTAGYASHRHFLTLAAVAAAWAASALAGLRRRTALILGGLVCAALLAQACRPLRDEKAYRKDLGLWLQANAPENCWIASRAMPEIAYYAGRMDLNCEIGGEPGFEQYLGSLDGWLRHCAPRDARDRPLVLKAGGRPGAVEILLLERERDAALVRMVSARRDWEPWALPPLQAGRFAAFRRKDPS